LWVLSVYRATLAMQGKTKDPTRGAISYYNPKKVKKPKWDFAKLTFTKNIHNHRFYKEK
jgi:spore germination cell wall hydrolase CwlJ-like protein